MLTPSFDSKLQLSQNYTKTTKTYTEIHRVVEVRTSSRIWHGIWRGLATVRLEATGEDERNEPSPSPV